MFFLVSHNMGYPVLISLALSLFCSLALDTVGREPRADDELHVSHGRLREVTPGRGLRHRKEAGSGDVLLRERDGQREKDHPLNG